MQFFWGLFLKLLDALHIGEEIVVTFATVKPVQMIRTICKNTMVWGKLQFVVLPFALLPFCPFALLPFCPFALISHNVLPKSFAPALALYVAIQATLMARARARAMFEGKNLCEIRARGQKGKNKGKTTN